jgi:hypothetical protein
MSPASGRIELAAKQAICYCTTASAKSVLLDARAAALDKNNQYDDKQHSGNDLNDRGIHFEFPLSINCSLDELPA